MDKHRLQTGDVLDLSALPAQERRYLDQLSEDARQGTDYLDLLRRVKGPDALPLQGGRITPSIAASSLYRAAHDIADRVGIQQGYLLAPDVVVPAKRSHGGDLLSLTEAAEIIGISRPAAHQALMEERLRGRRVGNAWVVSRPDAEAFKSARSERPSEPAIRKVHGMHAGRSRNA